MKNTTFNLIAHVALFRHDNDGGLNKFETVCRFEAACEVGQTHMLQHSLSTLRSTMGFWIVRHPQNAHVKLRRASDLVSAVLNSKR